MLLLSRELSLLPVLLLLLLLLLLLSILVLLLQVRLLALRLGHPESVVKSPRWMNELLLKHAENKRPPLPLRPVTNRATTMPRKDTSCDFGVAFDRGFVLVDWADSLQARVVCCAR